MKVEDANAVIDDYARYVKASMTAVQQGEGVCIVTPMLNRNNDCMNVYLADAPDGGIIVTDMGETIDDLEISGFSLTDQRRDKLESILAGYGVSRHDEELYIKTSLSELPARMNMLLQAMASTDDMYLLSKNNVKNLFTEDVGLWLLENDISSVEGPSFVGRSGMTHKFDYAIGRNKRAPTRLIKTVNNPGRREVQNALFGWEDVKLSQSEYKGYVFLNSYNTKSGNVSEESLTACQNYGLQPVIWGVNEDDFVEELAA